MFARLIDEAIPGICGFLQSSQTSDILEAVSFFVTGVPAGVGVVKMYRFSELICFGQINGAFG